MPCGSRLLLGLSLLGLVACGARSGIPTPDGGTPDFGPDFGVDFGPDVGPPCQPEEEVCNGLDDDCDDVVDDGIPCATLDGAALRIFESADVCGQGYYRYDAPDTASANPSPDVRRPDRVVVLIQYSEVCSGASVVVIADEPDMSGGMLEAEFRIDPMEGADILISDEPNECQYNVLTGLGSCSFVWQPCCTDGFMLGEFTDGCVEITLSQPVGIEELLVLDGIGGPLLQREFGEPFELCITLEPEA